MSLWLFFSSILAVASGAPLTTSINKALILKNVEKLRQGNQFNTGFDAFLYLALVKQDPALCKDLVNLKAEQTGDPKMSFFWYVSQAVLPDCLHTEGQPSLKAMDAILTDLNAPMSDLFYAVAGLKAAPKTKSKKKKHKAIIDRLLENWKDGDMIVSGSLPDTAFAVGVIHKILGVRELPEETVKAIGEKLKMMVPKIAGLTNADQLVSMKQQLDAVIAARLLIQSWTFLSDFEFKLKGSNMYEEGKGLTQVVKFLHSVASSNSEAVAAMAFLTLQESTNTNAIPKKIQESLFSFVPYSIVQKSEDSATMGYELCSLTGERMGDEIRVKLVDFGQKAEFKLPTEGKSCKYAGQIKLENAQEHLEKFNKPKYEFSINDEKFSVPVKVQVQRGGGNRQIEVESLVFTAGSSRGTAKEIYKAEVGETKKALDRKTKLDDTMTIYSEISLRDTKSPETPFSPKQLAILLVPQHENPPLGVLQETVVWYTSKDGEPGSFSASIPLSSKRTIVAYDGLYEVYVLVGDSEMTEPIKKHVGTANLRFSIPADLTISAKEIQANKKLNLTPAVSSSEFQYYAPVEPIYHQFRKPEARPNPLISLIFLFGIIGCVVIFILLVLFYWNMKLSTHSVTAFPFLVGLAFCVFLLWNFYLWCPILQLGSFLLPGMFVMMFLGNRELSACKETRWKLIKAAVDKKE